VTVDDTQRTDTPPPVRGDLPEPTRMLNGATVYRVVWQCGTDVLVGYCWCGTELEATDPVGLWQ